MLGALCFCLCFVRHWHITPSVSTSQSGSESDGGWTVFFPACTLRPYRHVFLPELPWALFCDLSSLGHSTSVWKASWIFVLTAEAVTGVLKDRMFKEQESLASVLSEEDVVSTFPSNYVCCRLLYHLCAPFSPFLTQRLYINGGCFIESGLC